MGINMIITRTPLRISLCGGGTDMPEFYQNNGGAVVSFAIDKFIYVMVNKKFDGGTRVSYSITENVSEPEMLKHDIARETLAEYKARGMEVVSVSDIPGQGSGLGSSSAFAVGLDLAMRAYMGLSDNYHPTVFAEAAYKVEREKCGHPVGKQDHYAAAYGGLNLYQFNKDNTVTIEPMRLTFEKRGLLLSKLLLFWTGNTRDARTILEKQAKALKEYPAVKVVGEILRDEALELAQMLRKNELGGIGAYLNENWKHKKELTFGITNKTIDDYYDRAIEAGAEGGKLCGAGGSGFMLFYAPTQRHYAIEEALGLRRVYFNICNDGAQVIYEDTHV